jgi:hypothetical protein
LLFLFDQSPGANKAQQWQVGKKLPRYVKKISLRFVSVNDTCNVAASFCGVIRGNRYSRVSTPVLVPDSASRIDLSTCRIACRERNSHQKQFHIGKRIRLSNSPLMSVTVGNESGLCLFRADRRKFFSRCARGHLVTQILVSVH